MSEKVEKRRKKLSKRIYGTSHTLSEDEAKFVVENACKQLIFGTGHDANGAAVAGGAAFLNERGCKVIAMKAKAAAQPGNRLDGCPIAVSSISCSSCCSLVAG